MLLLAWYPVALCNLGTRYLSQVNFYKFIGNRDKNSLTLIVYMINIKA